MARPKLKIDPKLVQDLAALGCKTTEIAVVVGCSVDTLDRSFAEEMAKGRENLKISLRRWQLESAKKGNVVMLIWLGKQLLKQTDKVEQISSMTVKTLSPKDVQNILTKDPFLNEPDRRTIELRAEEGSGDPKTSGGNKES